MLVKTYNLTDDPDITLTAYIPDISEEMKNMKINTNSLMKILEKN